MYRVKKKETEIVLTTITVKPLVKAAWTLVIRGVPGDKAICTYKPGHQYRPGMASLIFQRIIVICPIY